MEIADLTEFAESGRVCLELKKEIDWLKTQNKLDRIMKDYKENKEELEAEAKALMKKLEPFVERTNELLKIKNHSPEELEELVRLMGVFNKAWPVLEKLGNFFGESAYKQQVSAYYHIKELAGKGNIKAKEAIEELKPLFEEALKERMKGSES